MSKIIVFSPLLIFIILAIFFWQRLKQDPNKIPSVFINKPVPTFSAPSLLKPQELLTNKIFTGQVTLLNVFATWCESCQIEHPILIDIKNSNQVQIIGLDYKDISKNALQWLSIKGNPYEVIINDPQGIVGINFGVYGTPETFLIDKNGIIRDKFIGAITENDWKNKLLPEIQNLSRRQ